MLQFAPQQYTDQSKFVQPPEPRPVQEEAETRKIKEIFSLFYKDFLLNHPDKNFC